MGNRCGPTNCCTADIGPFDVLTANIEAIPDSLPNFKKSSIVSTPSPPNSPKRKSSYTNPMPKTYDGIPTPNILTEESEDSDDKASTDAKYRTQLVVNTHPTAMQTVMYQGELLRYRFGSKASYIPRWAEITGKEFIYYRNQVSAVRNERPLQRIPLTSICEVKV